MDDSFRRRRICLIRCRRSSKKIPGDESGGGDVAVISVQTPGASVAAQTSLTLPRITSGFRFASVTVET